MYLPTGTRCGHEDGIAEGQNCGGNNAGTVHNLPDVIKLSGSTATVRSQLKMFLFRTVFCQLCVGDFEHSKNGTSDDLLLLSFIE